MRPGQVPYSPKSIEYEGRNFIVVRIDEESFDGAEVSKIYIPSSVEIIGERAFQSSRVQNVYFEENSQ